MCRRLSQKANELQSHIDQRRTTAELSDLGWTPLHLSCLPEPDQQILVGGPQGRDPPAQDGRGFGMPNILGTKMARPYLVMVGAAG